jgi:hypothetical protein
VLLVLAGVNGAGKSSIGGNVMLRRLGLTWFNPDTYSRLLIEQVGLPLARANALAWQHSRSLSGFHGYPDGVAAETIAATLSEPPSP